MDKKIFEADNHSITRKELDGCESIKELNHPTPVFELFDNSKLS
jgi:hypothetical protein